MVFPRSHRWLAVLLPFLTLTTLVPVHAAWIRPDSVVLDQSFKPVPLYWFEVKETPYVYRTVLDVGDHLVSAPAALESLSYLYIFVDGHPVFSRDRPKPGDREEPVTLDLAPQLSPGTHILAVSAPRTGFALKGLLQYRDRTVSLDTGPAWRVRRFAPTTILEDQDWLRSPSANGGEKVIASDPFNPDVDFTRIARVGLARHTVSVYDNVLWETGLLVQKGILIHDGAEYGWGTAARVHPAIRAAAKTLYAGLFRFSDEIDSLRATPRALSTDQLDRLAAGVNSDQTKLHGLSRRQFLLDERTALSLARQVISINGLAPGPSPAAILAATHLDEPARQLAKIRQTLETHWGRSINFLNRSRDDRLGWLPDPEFADSRLAAWGVRVNPVSAPLTVKLDGRNWRFQPDPDHSGISEKRQTIGYNIENQWSKISVPGSWSRSRRFKDYRGTAWYRTRAIIPSEWESHEVVLRFEASEADQVWLNDRLVGSSHHAGFRRYTLRSDAIRPGTENLLAFEITGTGAERGLTGPVSLSCPTLATEDTSAPRASVLATPLSPIVILSPETTELRLRGWTERNQPGPERIYLPDATDKPGRSLAAGQTFRSSRAGKLPQNWILLWMRPESKDTPDRPILLVLGQAPREIRHERGSVSIIFSEAHAQVAAVRPWPLDPPDSASSPEVIKAIHFWQRSALSVPVNYLSLTRIARPGPPPDYPFDIHHVPPGPVLDQVILYDNVHLPNPWNVEPLAVAPLPTLASYAAQTHYPGLQLPKPAARTVQQNGLLAPYQVVLGATRVEYSYPIEPFPRLYGFTSFMFSGSDTGVPGNVRELSLLKTAGINSYRTQHDFSTQRSPFFPRSDPRTRVEIMADYCNAIGINYMNNIDQTLGRPRQYVRTHYSEFMEQVDRHYESIARQLHDRPFHDVAYDLINEPFDHQHVAYNRAIRTLTARIRAIDPVHLLYVEPCESWGAVAQLRLIKPTGDPLTVYSFHDYNFRLFRKGDRWPTLDRDITDICRHWTEAFCFEIGHAVPLHCGEFGGFGQASDNSLAQMILMNDFFRIFDQFGMHFHYYSGRTAFGRRADGSMALSNVIRAYRRHAMSELRHGSLGL